MWSEPCEIRTRGACFISAVLQLTNRLLATGLQWPADGDPNLTRRWAYREGGGAGEGGRVEGRVRCALEVPSACFLSASYNNVMVTGGQRVCRGGPGTESPLADRGPQGAQSGRTCGARRVRGGLEETASVLSRTTNNGRMVTGLQWSADWDPALI